MKKLDKFAKTLIHMRNYFSGLYRCHGGCIYNYLVIGLRPYRYKPKIMKMYLVWQSFSLFTENPLSFDRCNSLCNEMRTMFLLTQETLWQLCCFRVLWNLTRNISKWSTDLKQSYHFNARSVNKKWCVCVFFNLLTFNPLHWSSVGKRRALCELGKARVRHQLTTVTLIRHYQGDCFRYRPESFPISFIFTKTECFRWCFCFCFADTWFGYFPVNGSYVM